MTPSEKLVTQSETFEFGTTVAIRNRVAANLSASVFLVFNAFSIKTFHFYEEDAGGLYLHTDKELFLMQFCLSGGSTLNDEKNKQVGILEADEYNIFHVPFGSFKVWSSVAESVVLNVFMERDFFVAHLPQRHLYAARSSLLQPIFAENQTIQAQLRGVLNDIKSCAFDLQLKQLYFKAKVIELLTLQLAQHQIDASSIALKPGQLEKMSKVKELIDRDLSESPSLSHLARLAGTNEQYLKKHFKLIYGQTVFGYILSSKMHKAKQMLLTGENTVAEIAELVGYKHATHFTKAFKNFFGHLPKLLKMRILLGGHFLATIEFELFEALTVL